MKVWFFLGATALVLFEIANVYFIMPFPYSQEWNTVRFAYWLYTLRWPVRLACLLLMVAGFRQAWRTSLWQRLGVTMALLFVAAVTYEANYVMAADAMFLQPRTLTMEPATKNKVEAARIVIGVVMNGEARAYPVQFIGYHHQVRDTIGGTPVMVTYCTVCRTGRVFSPVIDGKPETFRLVGMDHFNAMFEDASTGSWWRQATGQAITGPRTGTQLMDIASQQMRLAQWMALHPDTLVMQADPTMLDAYDKDFDYERGTSRSALTGTNPESWQRKSWVVGITVNGASRAYDWNRLRRERVVNDELGGTPLVLVLAPDDESFTAFVRPSADTRFVLDGDRLVGGGASYDLGGHGANQSLTRVPASQEFWHSWKSFQPTTDTY